MSEYTPIEVSSLAARLENRHVPEMQTLSTELGVNFEPLSKDETRQLIGVAKYHRNPLQLAKTPDGTTSLLKTIVDRRPHEPAAQNAQNEMSALKRLSGTGLAPETVSDKTYTEQGNVTMAMEFMRDAEPLTAHSVTLNEELSRQTQPEGLIESSFRSLKDVHKKGVICGDLTNPSNIMLRKEPVADTPIAFVDFENSQVTDSDPNRTQLELQEAVNLAGSLLFIASSEASSPAVDDNSRNNLIDAMERSYFNKKMPPEVRAKFDQKITRQFLFLKNLGKK